MEEDVLIRSDESVKYRIKDYTGEEFDHEWKSPRYSWKKSYWLSEIAVEIASEKFSEDPMRLDDFECPVDLLYKGEIRSYKVTGEPDINWSDGFQGVTKFSQEELELGE